VKNEKALKIPAQLKSPSPKNYKYPHDFGGYVEQEYLEKRLNFYKNSNIGFEKTIKEWLMRIKASF